MAVARSTFAMLAIAFLGGIVGAILTFVMLDPDGEGGAGDRGTILRISAEPESLFWAPDVNMWCSNHHRFCIPRFEDPAEARALYLGDPHEHFRRIGCFVDWRPDFDLSQYQELTDAERAGGAFRGGCSGSTFLPDGTRVFGPSPRNLDEFPVRVRTETVELSDGPQEVRYLEVDTTRLICGDWTATRASGETPEDRCELAPPFD
ncbi:MAG: hypothetical protein AB7F65_06705 [Dehalococcoidia bacterium]